MKKKFKIFKLGLLALLVLIGVSYLARTSSPVYFFSRALSEKLRPVPSENKAVQLPQKHLDPETLKKYLTVEASFLGTIDNISLDFKDLSDNQSMSINETRFWIPASTIKAFVLLELFRQKQLGLINLADQVTIKAQNVVPTELESEDFTRLREGVTATIKQLAESMIIESNNISYNTLLDVLDRRNINATLRILGFTNTTVGEKLNLDDNQLALDAQVPGRDFNTTTAADFAKLFELIYNKKVVGADEMLAILKRQKLNDMLPVFLPSSTVVAHKTGEWDPRYHDGGIIYKPDDPFILTVFTDSGSPTIVAKLAQVAYYQDPSIVGTPLSFANKKNQSFLRTNVKYLAEAPQSTVLGTSTQEASIPLSAADLGIKAQDLLVNQNEAKKIQPSIIAPSSIYYPFKLLLENFEISQAVTANQKVNIFLSLANNRLSEVKALLNQGEVKNAKVILDEGEKDLHQAVKFIDKSNQKDIQVLRLRKLNSLYFAVLGISASQVNPLQKEAYIDAVYDFYKKNTTEVKSVTRPTMPATLLQQQPIIGVITQIKNNTVTVKTDTGETRTLVITPDITKSRDFNSAAIDQTTTLAQGNKIAVLPYQKRDGTIIPLFILRNLPKELPKKKEGVVLEIDPARNTLKIQDNKGQNSEVKIGPDTQVKGKDTTVTAGGIIAGSTITVSGNEQAIASPTIQAVKNQAQPATGISPKTTTVTAVTKTINATTVTVIKNNSGKKEKVEPAKNPPPPPKKEEPKKIEKPKSFLNIFDYLLTYLHKLYEG